MASQYRPNRKSPLYRNVQLLYINLWKRKDLDLINLVPDDMPTLVIYYSSIRDIRGPLMFLFILIYFWNHFYDRLKEELHLKNV